MEIVSGKIVGYDERTEQLLIRAPYGNYDRMAKRQYETVEIGLQDGRQISPAQRALANILIREIADWCGDLPEYMRRTMKMAFISTLHENIERNLFSLSDCDMTTARGFITYLIEFIILHEVPTKEPLTKRCEDIGKLVYFCLMNKRCCITHKRAGLELHHVDAVGMGRSRNEITHIGMRALPLGAQYHEEAHIMGNTEFMDKYHLEPVAITKEIAKVHRLKTMEGIA